MWKIKVLPIMRREVKFEIETLNTRYSVNFLLVNSLEIVSFWPQTTFFSLGGGGGRNTLKKKKFWIQPTQSLRVACYILHFGQVSLKSVWWLVSHLPGPLLNSVLNARYPVNSPTYKLAYIYLWSVYVGEFVVLHTYSDSRVIQSQFAKWSK